jgi:hypothetical protein
MVSSGLTSALWPLQNQCSILKVPQPELQHFADPHAAPGHQFQHEPIPGLGSPKNDLVHGFLFDDFPFRGHALPIELADPQTGKSFAGSVSPHLGPRGSSFARRRGLAAKFFVCGRIGRISSYNTLITPSKICKSFYRVDVRPGRSLIFFRAGHELGFSMTELGKRLGLSAAAASKPVRRDAAIAHEKGYLISGS